MQSSDLSVLVTLDALLQEGSVTGAARRVGLSTPAMSHALARIRERLGDPILVRAGRTMVLTPRAEALKSRVHTVVVEAQRALEPEREFVAKQLARTFVVNASDYVLTILGPVLDSLLQQEAPLVSLRFVPNSSTDAQQLRDGASDLAVGIYGELPQEVRTRPLLTDRFVCVVREGHPSVGKRLTLEQYVKLSHIQVAPRGKPGGYVDDALAEKGLSRTVMRAVPFFFTALQLASKTDYLLTVSERLATLLAPSLGLRILAPPFELRPYALSLVWHPRFDADPGHRFFRDLYVRAAKEVAGDHHADSRKRLEPPSRSAAPPRRGKRRPRA